ncbi:MAG: acetoacetate--CoA ligase [Pseudomonadota bacterium]
MNRELNHKPLWAPSPARVQASRLREFMDYAGERNGRSFKAYEEFHQWSVVEAERFWSATWDFVGVHSSSSANQVLARADEFPGAEWFPGSRLNFAENLLENNLEGVALVARLENGSRREMTWTELRDTVALAASALRTYGVSKGDRVAAVLPNCIETVVAMLATASIGAVWSSCSPDFGANGIIDRFGQIEPKILFACDGYFYNGKTIRCSEKLVAVRKQIASIERLVLVGCVGVDGPESGSISSDSTDASNASEKTVSWNRFLSVKSDARSGKNGSDDSINRSGSGRKGGIEYEQLPFDHPLYILFSSGTTGVPKCIVHSAGGTLLQHKKEHQLHVGIRPGDVFFYYTTCGWMMWNWLVSGLASGATLLLYDGSPFYPAPSVLLDIADEDRVAVLGVGAKYIAAIEKAGLKPRTSHKLSKLRTMLSTGSPLSDASFRYVYRDVKADLCLSSISGGTDIVSCFALGSECLPVYEGEIQCRGLGMAVEIWNEQGQAVMEEKGELVCTKPFPSAPAGFWNDDQGERYHKAYFTTHAGVWAHGDYAEITANKGIIIHGRSDAVLNPGGVRIGTAEIYRLVEQIDEVVDSVCVGQSWDDDVRVVLFVVLKEELELSDTLANHICQTIRQGATPRHVPAKVIAVADVPRTRSGKVAELAVRKVINGEAVDSVEALANPECLECFEELDELST